MSIRVLCVDDHPIVGEGLRSLLNREEDIEVVALGENGERAIALFEEHRPDVTILDLKMPGVRGVEAVVREVYAGGRPIPSAIATRLASRIAQPALTPRETEVLRLVAKGLRNKEIAGKLNISEETAQVHVRNIIYKLGVHDRTEAVTVALRRGILDLD